MARTYVTDLTHFEAIDDPDVETPGPARRLGLFLRAITEQASGAPAGTVIETAVACRARPRRRACPGRIEARRDPDPQHIRWWCPRCGESGMIHNWIGTRWDRSGGMPPVRRALPAPKPAGALPGGDAVDVDSADLPATLDAVRAIIAEFDQANREGRFVEPVYLPVVRTVLGAVETHLCQRGIRATVAQAAIRELLDHARDLFAATWLTIAHDFHDDNPDDAPLVEEDETRAARLIFDAMMHGHLDDTLVH